MRLSSYSKVALATTLTMVLYAVTSRRYVWLEGRVRGGVLKNSAGCFRYRPERFVRPTIEEEIVKLVKSSRSLRVFGSGHSFNKGVVSDETLVSLDDYSGLLCKYPEKNQIVVRGGTRVRDVVKLLSDEGLAFRALPSTMLRASPVFCPPTYTGRKKYTGRRKKSGALSVRRLCGLS